MPSSAVDPPPAEVVEMTPLVEIRNLTVVARGETGMETEIVKDVSFAVNKGEVVGLIGESGSGKTTIALAVLGHTRFGCRIAGGSVWVGDSEVTALNRAGLAAFRGRRVAYIAQSAAASFNPSRRIMAQVIESALIHGTATPAAADAKAKELFSALGLPDVEKLGNRYPHQVSGGQLQRLMAAMALITDPEVVIFDEPTTALDVTTQIEVLKAFKSAIRDRATTGIYVTHDLAVIAQIADRIVVLRDGVVRETAATGDLIERPQHEYTQSLLAAAEPARRELRPATTGSPTPLLTVSGLVAGYGAVDADGRSRLPVLQDIDLTIARGQALGVIGESGSGKSTLARVIAGLNAAGRGEVTLAGETLGATIADRTREQLRRIQIVFQMADTALNPSVRVADIIGRPVTFYFGITGAARDARVRELIELTRLPTAVLERYPGDLSGGQKQRVNLARALAAKPDLLLCDEVTSALDTVVAAAILDLLVDLRHELGLTYMFISHDLKVVRAVCDDVLVLYAGRQVETMPAVARDTRLHHPYTQLLFNSVPDLERGWLERTAPAAVEQMQGTVTGSGCPFFARCSERLPGTCDREMPARRVIDPHTSVACFQRGGGLESRLQSPAPNSVHR
jgi:peptide/nickel transport system ATP-binding protein